MNKNVNIITRIESRYDECFSKDIYVYNEKNIEAKNKIRNLIRETLINLAHDYLEDEIKDINKATNEIIIEELSKKSNFLTYAEDEYLNFVCADSTREIDIDMEAYQVN